jgi:molybdopterin-binding protein
MSRDIHARLRIERRDFTLEVDLTLPGRGISGLFGHSGSGKTTCLRAMAGLERAADGYFAIGDEVWQDETRGLFVPPHQRALGVVFQEASLFPHLSVRGNMQFGERRTPAGKRHFALPEVAELLGIVLRCRIHARDVSLALVPQVHSSILNSVEATVVDLALTDTPGHVLVRLDVAGEPLLARITRRSADRLKIRPGLVLRAQIKAVALPA